MPNNWVDLGISFILIGVFIAMAVEVIRCLRIVMAAKRFEARRRPKSIEDE